MTPIARIIIVSAIILFTLGTVAWILTGNWQWFAGGGAILFGSFLAGGILSVDVKHPQRTQDTYQEPMIPTYNDNDPFSS